jgi:FMN phosphatase YigB (HAD superfamily)|tara:strand:+ start:657 stop:1016 length:360 start_codon:yes stop_codon:yes gene_type:complete
MKIKIVCFDIDNVICRTKKNFYRDSIPIKKNIKAINEIFDKGYYVKLFTSRFMGRSNENQKLATKKGYSLTQKQLKIWGVKYHKLIFGKPSYDLFIDDKSYNFNKDWSKDVISKLIKNK